MAKISVRPTSATQPSYSCKRPRKGLRPQPLPKREVGHLHPLTAGLHLDFQPIVGGFSLCWRVRPESLGLFRAKPNEQQKSTTDSDQTWISRDFFLLQDAQPSPLALLAATCSKIGHPGAAQQGQQQYKVIDHQGQILQATDITQLATQGACSAWFPVGRVQPGSLQGVVSLVPCQGCVQPSSLSGVFNLVPCCSDITNTLVGISGETDPGGGNLLIY